MAGVFALRIDGARDLERALAGLVPRARGRILVSALRAGGRPIVEDARRRAPVDTGALRDSIGIVMRRRERNAAVAALGLRREGRGGKVAFYGKFFEFGTETMAPQPFMRPALASQEQAAIRAFREKFWNRFQRESAR